MAEYLITRLPSGRNRDEIAQFFDINRQPFLVSSRVDEVSGFMRDFEEPTVVARKGIPTETTGNIAQSERAGASQRLLSGQDVQSKLSDPNSSRIQISTLCRNNPFIVGGSAMNSDVSLPDREGRALNAVALITKTAPEDSIVKMEEEPEDPIPLFSQDPSRPQQPTYPLFSLGTNAEALMTKEVDGNRSGAMQSLVKEEVDDDEIDEEEDWEDVFEGYEPLVFGKMNPRARFPCDICWNYFPNRRILQKHINTHSTCDDCGEAFVREKWRDEHRALYCTAKMKKGFIRCAVSDERCTSRKLLQKHWEYHMSEDGSCDRPPDSLVKPFECNVCLKRYALESSLKKHERVHIGQ